MNNPDAKPIDLVLQDPNALLMKLTNGVDIVWQRAAVAAAPEPAADSPAQNESIGSAAAQNGG